MNKKQFLFFFGWGAMAFTAQAQSVSVKNDATIKAKIDSLQTGTWIYYGPSSIFDLQADSVQSVKGGFTIHLPVKPGYGDLYTFQIGTDKKKSGVRTELFLSAGDKVKILSKGSEFTSATFSGSLYTNGINDFNAFLKKQHSTTSDAKSFFHNAIKWTQAHPSVNSAAMYALQTYYAMQQQVESLINRYKGQISASQLRFQVDQQCPPDSVTDIINLLTPEAKNNIPCKMFEAKMKGQLVNVWQYYIYTGAKGTVIADIKGLAVGQTVYYGPMYHFATEKDSVSVTRSGHFTLTVPIKAGNADFYTFQIGNDLKVRDGVTTTYIAPGDTVYFSGDSANFAGCKKVSLYEKRQKAFENAEINADSLKTYSNISPALLDYLERGELDWTSKHPSDNSAALFLLYSYLNLQQQYYNQLMTQPQIALLLKNDALAVDKLSVQNANNTIPIERVINIVKLLTPEAKNNAPCRRITQLMEAYKSNTGK